MPSPSVPFAPRVSAEIVCAAAVIAAALALLPVVTWTVAELQRGAVEPVRLPASDLIGPALIGASLLALAVIQIGRAGSVNACFAGGVLCGLGCAIVRGVRCGMPFGDGPSLSLGVMFGLAYGAACVYPVSELHAARHPRAHAVTDVQLGNTGAWIALLATGGFFAATTLVTWWSSAVLATVSLAVAIGARMRHALRRRWLVRVMSGRVPGWAVEAVRHGARDDEPVLDLLQPTSDERFVVTSSRGRGSPYRVAPEAAVRGRLAPDW